MLSFQIIFFEYICPLLGAIFANLMFSAPIRDVHMAVKQGSLGDLNPTPWAVMTGNCTGWIVYSFLLQNWFIFWANAPGLIISIWLNIAAAKLQYCDRLSEDIRKSMVNFLRENEHLMGETASMNFGGSGVVQENDVGDNSNNSRRTSLMSLSPPHRSIGSSGGSGGGLASTAALLQQFYRLELKEEREDIISGDEDDKTNGEDEEVGGKGERIEENDVSTLPPSEVIGDTLANSQTTKLTDHRVRFQSKSPAITSKAQHLLGLSNTTTPNSERLLEMMEYSDVHAATTSSTGQQDSTSLFPSFTRSSMSITPPTGGTLERLTKVAFEVAIQKSEAPAPHERVLVVIVAIWLILIATISLFNMTHEQRLTIIGISVNLNISFFYGAPLSCIVKVIKTRDSSSIHRYTMMLNTGCALFFMLFGIGVDNKYLIVPNGIGVVLGVTQAVLRLVIPNKDNLYPEEDKALMAIRSVVGHTNSLAKSIFAKPAEAKAASTTIKNYDGEPDKDALKVESTDELDSNSISSTSISSTDFLNYLYSSTLPKQLVRAFAPIGESGTAIPKQVVERELSSVRDESEKVDEEAVAESDDRQLSSVRDE
ncbi:hypothetical protein ACHAXH_006889, partial [Discostella pseudostelligera]